MLLPSGSASRAWPGQVVPAEPPVSAPVEPPQTPPPAPYTHAWTVPIDAGTDLEMIATPSLVITAAAAVPLEARALSDGHVVWASPLTSRSLVRADDRIYGLDDRHVYALAEASGDLAWTVDTDEPGHSLAVGARHLLVLSDHAVRAYGRADGVAAWRTELPAPPATALALSGSLAVVGLQDRSVLAFDPATGAIRWQTSFDDIPRAVTIAGERVYLTLPLVAICAVLPSTGRLDWCTTELRVPAVGAPVMYRDRLYLALLDTTLRAFEPETGTMLQRESLLGRPVSAPMPMGPTLIAPLSQNAFAVVGASGALTIVPAPGAPPLRSIRRAAISQDAATIVALTIEVAGSLHLSAYTPAQEKGAAQAPAGPADPAGPRFGS